MGRSEVRDLHPLIWLWSIPVPLLIHLSARQLDPDNRFFSTWIESESGLIENATALLLLPATALAITLAFRCHQQFGRAFFIWFAGFAIMCFGFAGEEVSWGQHWLGWNSPEYFAENNRQGETNFHNLNIHFGRVVKTLLTLAIIVGGLILPLRRRGKSHDVASSRRWSVALLPTLVCVPAAAFVFGVRLVERCKTWFDLDWRLLDVNLKELQELYIAIFLLIYVWSMYKRHGAASAAPG
ncbi:MAG: hypothetical protein ACU85U_03800 [Gammaproteobacteria bacterium]|jgi:hypothetical protein